MNPRKPIKINQLLSSLPQGVVVLSSWLAQNGYSYDLQKQYRKSSWLESIGSGAMIRSHDNVGYEGALFALQTQAQASIHPGGKTALSLLGKAHYLEFQTKKVILFGGMGEQLSTWFKNHDWGVVIDFHPTSFLPADTGITEMAYRGFSLKISTAARAMMECLYLAPDEMELTECYELMEGLNNLNPSKMQTLLEQCNSVKVKRLFLYLAEKAGHEWFQYLNKENIDLGSGKRSIVKDGVYISKYQITVPKGMKEYGEREV